MAEINKDLFNALIKQQINLSRYGNKQAADMVSLLNAANKEIVAKILARGADKSFTSRRLNALLAELQQIIAGTCSEASDTLKSEMAAFAEHSAEVAGGMLAMEMPLKWSPVKMSAEQLAAVLDKTPIRIGTDKSLLFDELFKSLAGGMEEKVRGALRLGMVEGESVHDMVKRLEGTAANRFKDGVLEGPRRDLYNLTHSVVQHVNNQAAQAMMVNNSEVLKGWTYMATFDSKTCSQCFSNSGKTFPLGKGPIPTLHINCLPGDSLVSLAGKVLAVSKRWYDGNIVTIKTASGKTLSGTPNHPILTPSGWVAIGSVNVGGNVISHSGSKFAPVGVDGYDKHIPSRIEDVANAFLGHSEVTAIPVPLTAENFHGDGSGSEVAIIGADRELWVNDNTPFSEHIHKLQFVSGNNLAPGVSSFYKNFRSLFHPAHGIMGGFRKLQSLLRSGICHSRKLLLASISGRYSRFFKKFEQIRSGSGSKFFINPFQAYSGFVQFCDCGHVHYRNNTVTATDDIGRDFVPDGFFVYPIFKGESQERGSGEVFADKNLNINQPVFELPDGDPLCFEPAGDGSGADSVLAAQILSGGSGEVFFDNIIDIQACDFSGHVYNLQTESSWYVAEGIVTHNCRCFQAPNIKTWKELGFDNIPEYPTGTRATSTGVVKADLSFNDWLKDQPRRTQDELLGPTRGKMFADGKIKLDKFTDASGKLYTLDQLKKR